jgi:GH24 family phage-related lysozyme (muramidase)
MNRKHTADMITKNEGVRYIVYNDTEGHPTIGIGFNLDRKDAAARLQAVNAYHGDVLSGEPLTEAQVSALFQLDLDDAIGQANSIVANFSEHPDPVQSVIVDMIFNLGARGFAGFTKTIAALERMDYCSAAAQMGDSRWAQQVPNRAKRNIGIVMDYCHA